MPLTPQQQATFRALAAEIEGIDIEVYKRFERDPLEPIIGLGEQNLRIGFFGRDPGREEVRRLEPFIGAGGQLVKKALYERLHGEKMPNFDASRAVDKHFFWINTVPYKPVGNKAWSMKIKRHFHDLVKEILISRWEGRALITLGREAFLWFGINRPQQERARLEAFWKREDRFESSIEVTLETYQGETRIFTLYPLPHPSPLNQTWYSRFTGLLNNRLEQLDVHLGNLTVQRS